MEETNTLAMGLNAAYARELQHEMYQLTRTLALVDQISVAASGTTVAQTYTLLAFPPRGELTMNELSERMNLAGSTMTRVVDKLVAQGLVARSRDDADRRVVRVELTDRGRELRAEMERTYDRLFERLTEHIDEGDRAAFLRALRRVTGALTEVADCC